MASGFSATVGWVSINSKIRSDEAIACSTWLYTLPRREMGSQKRPR